MTILVAGGGIGGLAAALALARQGLQVTVLEQAGNLGEIGAGIQIGPNAFHALDRLGVGALARDKAVYVDGLVLMDAVSDQRICTIPLEAPFRQHFRNPYAVIHRADLHGVLLQGCRADPRVALRTAARVVDYAHETTGVVALLENGERLPGQALIGADGLRSAVRARLVGDGEPRVSGHTTYRSVIPTEQMPEELRWNAATLWAGPKCHIVHYPLQGWKVFNLVATVHTDASEAVAGEPVPTELVRASFAHVVPRAQRIIHAAESWKRWVLCDREPQENWVDGRVALLGDAAHPMLQYMAQGACMALEDAVCLGETLGAELDNIPAALAAYAAARLPRTTRLQLASRAMGEYVYHPAGAQRLARNAWLGAKSPADFYTSLDWLYGFGASGA
ncbi:3-hydroxybenzoate 6-monooxygenase [Ferrovibrio sp.]|uniref:3-hydroxybenzoate 6-monooxygenase n=1 Tax=Ferrovibrio sp. TaxID=1917215 RepID=UPI001B679993|nr:3-hydroxybenzoate 6-monooxygenase [Ferrovibrio sp.]MBP7062813.1 3-hydroxybenzoate 6-monooxygenase [Ferrovibrio sp.]